MVAACWLFPNDLRYTKMHGPVKIKSHTSLFLAVDLGDGLASRPVRYTHRGSTPVHVYRQLV